MVKHYGNLSKICKDHLITDKKYKDTRGLWIYGPAGVGKSREARTIAGVDYYPKLCNKWWDGYKGEKTVIMDDIDPSMTYLRQ